jgi:hypothetical protein
MREAYLRAFVATKFSVYSVVHKTHCLLGVCGRKQPFFPFSNKMIFSFFGGWGR